MVRDQWSSMHTCDITTPSLTFTIATVDIPVHRFLGAPLKPGPNNNDRIHVLVAFLSASHELSFSKTNTALWVPLIMPFAKAQVLLTAFLVDLLKPVATGMTSYKERLLVPQSLYCWPFSVDVGGGVYYPNVNSRLKKPIGMGEGWPARQAGTKLSVIVDGDLYALDPSNSLYSAKIKVCDYEGDSQKVAAGDVPIHDFIDSESPYLLVGLLGKIHVITKDADHNITVFTAEQSDLASAHSILSSSDNSYGKHAESSAESRSV